MQLWVLAALCLPCCHAIACIAYDTIPIEKYVSNCYTITEFNKTYDHVLEPVEGMSAWPVSTRPKPKAPGYIKMPGRPKRERTREVGEKPKSKKVSKVGNVITCSKCKGKGHNKTRCEKINGTGQYAPTVQSGGSNGAQGGAGSGGHGGSRSGGAQSNAPQIMVVVHTALGSSASIDRKRKSNDSSGNSYGISTQSGPSTVRPNKTSARAKTTTTTGGSATVSMLATVPSSNAMSTVKMKVSSGATASAHVNAQEHSRKQTKHGGSKSDASATVQHSSF